MAQSVKATYNRCVEYIRKKIAHAEEHGLSHLSSIRVLADEARVSYVTMWKAVSHFSSQGIIHPVQGKGIVIYREPDDEERADENEASPGPSWLNVADDLKKKILWGEYSAGGRLPSCKEIQARYSVSFRTARKAFECLREQNLAEPSGKGFCVSGTTEPKVPLSLVFISRGSRSGNLRLGIFDHEIVRALEADCFRYGLSLRIVSYHAQGNSESAVFAGDAGKVLPGIPDGRDIIGYFFNLKSHNESDLKLAKSVVSYRKRSVIFDQLGGLNKAYVRQLTQRKDCCVLSVEGGSHASFAAFRYLFSRGHSHFAYISTWHDAAWSQRRLESLRRACGSAACGITVSAFTDNGIGDAWDLNESASNRSSQDALWDSLKTWHQTLSPARRDGVDSVLRPQLRVAIGRGEVSVRLEPLIESALADKKITAWVAANDITAIHIVRLLQKRGIRVPGDISLISYDDSDSALEARITSYNFNMRGIVHTALQFIRNSRLNLPFRGSKAQEIPGYIVERETVARIPDKKQGSPG